MALTEAERRRNSVAALTRHRPGSAELVAARRDLAAEKIAAYIRRVAENAPPLTPEQRDRIALLLRGASASDHVAA